MTAKRAIHHNRAEWCLKKYLDALDASVAGGDGASWRLIAAHNDIVKAFADRDQLLAACRSMAAVVTYGKVCPPGFLAARDLIDAAIAEAEEQADGGAR